MLLEHFEDERSHARRERLHLEVREGNHALRLYETAGFSLWAGAVTIIVATGTDRYDALTLAKRAGYLR